MCGQLGRAWGNAAFGEVSPSLVVCRAAELHDDGWRDWERQPTLDRRVGLPHTFDTAPFGLHLAIHSAWAHSLAATDPYVGLLVSLHHASFFTRPGRVGLLRDGGRQIAAFLDDLEALQRELKWSLGVADDEIDRNRRLVRTWDGLSHDLLLGLAPRVRKAVPSLTGPVDISVERVGAVHTVRPWPFSVAEVSVSAVGGELHGRFDDQEAMREALARAPEVELSYTLRAAVDDDSAASISERRPA